MVDAAYKGCTLWTQHNSNIERKETLVEIETAYL